MTKINHERLKEIKIDITKLLKELETLLDETLLEGKKEYLIALSELYYDCGNLCMILAKLENNERIVN